MDTVFLKVAPGICGMECGIKAVSLEKKNVNIEITESDCTMIQQVNQNINNISLHDLFTPLTKNPIFIAAEEAGCHLACPVPVAVVKACEVILGLALPKDVGIYFIK